MVRIPGSEVADGFIAFDIEAEAQRFGRSVRRYILAGSDEGPLLESVHNDGADLAIVRIPTDRMDVVTVLFDRFDGALLADCLVVYTRDNQRSGPTDPPRNEGWDIERATVRDRPLVARMADQVFAGYRNHYSANPELADFELTDAYRDWVQGDIDRAGHGCFLARIDNEPVGFATVETEGSLSEGVLYGVLPEFQGRGIYRDLIRSTVAEFMKAGCITTRVSTQISNLPVQRVWASEGFFLTHSFFTVHVNQTG